MYVNSERVTVAGTPAGLVNLRISAKAQRDDTIPTVQLIVTGWEDDVKFEWQRRELGLGDEVRAIQAGQGVPDAPSVVPEDRFLSKRYARDLHTTLRQVLSDGDAGV